MRNKNINRVRTRGKYALKSLISYEEETTRSNTNIFKIFLIVLKYDAQ